MSNYVVDNKVILYLSFPYLKLLIYCIALYVKLFKIISHHLFSAGKFVALTVQQPVIQQPNREQQVTTTTIGSEPPPPPPIPPGGLIPGSRLSAALSMTSLFGGSIASGDAVASPTPSLVSKPSRDRITAPQPPNVSILFIKTEIL